MVSAPFLVYSSTAALAAAAAHARLQLAGGHGPQPLNRAAFGRQGRPMPQGHHDAGQQGLADRTAVGAGAFIETWHRPADMVAAYLVAAFWGLVGGYAQTSWLPLRQRRFGLDNCTLVGDHSFPGQSLAGVTVGAALAADRLLRRP